MSHILENFLSEKYKKNYHNHDFVRKADIKFKYLDGKIIKLFEKLDNQWLISCGITIEREKLLNDVYNFLKTLNIENIIECGLGTGTILDIYDSNDFNIKIIELNEQLVQYFNQACSQKGIELINDEIYNYISNHTTLQNTAYIIRLTCMGFETLEEYINFKNTKLKFSENSYFIFECSKIKFLIPDVIKVFKINNMNMNTYTYIIKL